MSESVTRADSVVPAQLSFLSIYNPSLGDTDETLPDQIVYYSSKSSRTSRRKPARSGSSSLQDEEKNERLRQIGLAQGMVEFAKAFSDGEAVDSIETEKSKIVLHELEPRWWMLASINLTRLSSTPDPHSPSKPSDDKSTIVEYSSREVCPHALLLQNLLRAHSIFLLHHAPSLQELYTRLTRPKFCGALERFWDQFIGGWDVLLHGNPAVEIYNGLKLAAGGELGIGVGEEEWGSGEREVLEGFIDRTDGLVDLVVSRFGDAPGALDTGPDAVGRTSEPSESQAPQWLGTGRAPISSDGVIFSGIGAITRLSFRKLSAWIEWLYKDGEDAYGVRNNPHSDRRRKRKKQNLAKSSDSRSVGQGRATIDSKAPANMPTSNSDIPAPVLPTARSELRKPSAVRESSREGSSVRNGPRSSSPEKEFDPASGTETLVKYLTLGVYGSSWGIPIKRPAVHQQVSHVSQTQNKADSGSSTMKQASMQHEDPKNVETSRPPTVVIKPKNPAHACFLIGLQGDLEQESSADDEGDPKDGEGNLEEDDEQGDWNSRTLLRTIHVERIKRSDEDSNNAKDDYGQADGYNDRVRVIVYVNRPFIFTFLFELHTDSLTMPSFYRSLHYQLGPLQRPLLSSTSPGKVFERLLNASTPTSTSSIDRSQPIYDLVYDPANLTVHTTIQGIPEPGTAAAEGLDITDSPWTRIEALNVHLQILNTHIATRRRPSELERTCKTSRGWWVVWMRLPHQSSTKHGSDRVHSEAFLVRKASDYIAPSANKAGGRFGRDLSGSSAATGWGPGKLAEGIGIDARRYIEGLLSLNR